MTQTTVIAFVTTFVLGPSLCALLLRLPSRLWILVVLAACVAVASVSALRVQMAGNALLSLGLLWLAWVLAVAMVALALRGRQSSAKARRWVAVTALLATTLPWFGLATARLMD